MKKTLTLKQFASLGGKAAAKKLTKKQRIERSRKGGLAFKRNLEAKNKAKVDLSPLLP